MGTSDDSAARTPGGFNYVTMRPLHARSNPSSIDSLEDWEQLRARMNAVPDDAMIRGLFPGELVRTVPGIKPARARYLPFSNYPMREYIDIIMQAARIKYPMMTAGNAVLRVGLDVYTIFASSLAGIAIFSVAQLDYQRIVEHAPKAYEVTLKPGRIHVLHNSPNEAKLEIRNVWAFPDIFHAGVWLGAMHACKVVGSIEITRRSLCDVDFLIKWSKP